MPANGRRTEPEHHTLYYVEGDGMIFLTHCMKPEYRLIEKWYHEDFVKAHCGEVAIRAAINTHKKGADG